MLKLYFLCVSRIFKERWVGDTTLAEVTKQMKTCKHKYNLVRFVLLNNFDELLAFLIVSRMGPWGCLQPSPVTLLVAVSACCSQEVRTAPRRAG